VSQSEKFDAQGKFIRRYLPQLAGLPDAAIHAPWKASPMERLAAGVTLGKDYPATGRDARRGARQARCCATPSSRRPEHASRPEAHGPRQAVASVLQ
jgi:deoxyribodipyrimidine photolyase